VSGGKGHVVDRAEDEYGEASEDASEQDAFHLPTSFSEEDSSKGRRRARPLQVFDQEEALMADPKSSPKQDSPQTPQSEPGLRRKHRKHGYRGYPNNPSVGGDIHWGSGFSGIGPTGASGPSGLPSSGIITERTRDDASKVDDDDTLDGD
jgi:hypothetical protein